MIKKAIERISGSVLWMFAEENLNVWDYLGMYLIEDDTIILVLLVCILIRRGMPLFMDKDCNHAFLGIGVQHLPF